MLVMLDQNLSSTSVSILNALFSRSFEAISFTVAMFHHFLSVFDVF